MTAEARTAGWCRNNAASFNKGFQQAVFHCLEVDRLGCWNDDGTDVLGNFFALENGSRFFHIPIEAVGTRANDNLVNLQHRYCARPERCNGSAAAAWLLRRVVRILCAAHPHKHMMGR